MIYKNLLITGGAGFVGSNLSIKFKEHYPNIQVIALDNLKRRGSELNIPRLGQYGVEFIHGDIRAKEDLNLSQKIDLIIDCSAEPSVMAGLDGNSEYLVNTNLMGTINCMELAKQRKADFLFLSSSRVYPISEIEQINVYETESRFEIAPEQKLEGISSKGISEEFPLGKVRSLYGATKLAGEFLLFEYMENYKIRGVINRCGVITGPWQMGRVDQGVIVLWMARHFWADKPLSYIGYNGTGKQVRDFIHIDDLFDAIVIQLEDMDKYNTEVFNVGGGYESSLSLKEMSSLCQKITNNKININSVKENRVGDIKLFITDSSKFQSLSGWKCKKTPEMTFTEIYKWIKDNKSSLERILN